MKYSLLLLSLVLLCACVEDESDYILQERENVKVDQIADETTGDENEELPDGQLVPGFHTVKLEVAE